MPNYYTVVGVCSVSLQEIAKSGKDDLDLALLENVNLCERIMPEPKELQMVVIDSKPVRCFHKITCELFEGMDLVDFGSYDFLPLSEQEISDLITKHGAKTWCDWRQKFWGTIWGTLNTKVRKLDGDACPILIEFQCAWSPPNPDMMAKISQWLKENYFVKEVVWVGHEPGSGSVRKLL